MPWMKYIPENPVIKHHQIVENGIQSYQFMALNSQTYADYMNELKKNRIKNGEINDKPR